MFEERKWRDAEALNYGMVEIERLTINCSVMMEMIMMMMNSWRNKTSLRVRYSLDTLCNTAPAGVASVHLEKLFSFKIHRSITIKYYNCQ